MSDNIQRALELALRRHGIYTRRLDDEDETGEGAVHAAQCLPGEGGASDPDRDMGPMHPQVVVGQKVKPQPTRGAAARGEEEKG